MDSRRIFYMGVLLISVFIAAISQVLLKKASQKSYRSPVQEYGNPLVICAYLLFAAATVLSVCAYRGVSLSMGQILETTGYLWVTLFGVKIFKEKISRRKMAALLLILAGIFVYAAGG